ncbi:MAG TPA: acetyl-CoA carboxylase biotin carboxyl carrier protein [Rhodospirillaceae bacterium]|nr:MAG: acetyl-CoA carboxylase, biotin carboxyl carrier protein [Alphaproteobacteria bacterium GWF2_58_20]HAU28648.1 acetyl-CoA carboxylase biotin carboxyl carrier protein [Rhodospirillaceae bacterium]
MKSSDVNAALIRKLAAVMAETGLTEIEITEGEKGIRVARHAHAAPAPAAPAPAMASPAVEVSAKPAADHPGTVKSPMVGTVYLKPSPDASPFVKVGDTVSEGQTLLIIEAMKVMNPIKAQKGGKVMEVLVSDAQPIEFGEPLLVIA